MSRILELDITKDFLSKIDDNAHNILEKWNLIKDIKNDEKLADMIGEKVTIIRATLNKLSFRGIVKYQKEKDQSSGWYNFYWSADFKKLANLIKQEHLERKTKLTDKLKQISEYDYFACKDSCREIPFEIAAEYDFVCPNCNQNLVLMDKKSQKIKIVSEIEKIEKDLDFIKLTYNI